VPGWDVIIEAPESADEELWVGRAVKWDGAGWDGAAVKLVTADTAGMHSFYDDVEKTRFDVGEYMMAVEFRALKEGSAEEYMYEPGGHGIDLVNSSLLCLAAEGVMQLIDGPPELKRVPRRPADIEKERAALLKRVWRLPLDKKALALLHLHCNK